MKEVLRLVVVVLVCTAVARWCGPTQAVVPHTLEQQLAEKGQRVLTATLGPGRGHIVVNVEFGELRRSTDAKTVGPGRALTASQEKCEEYAGSGPRPHDDEDEAKGYRQSVASHKWMVSERMDKSIRISPVQRVTVGVVVYDASPEQVEMLRPVLESAMGLDKTRDDRLEIGVCKR